MISMRHEPEVTRAKGRRAAAWYNEHARKPYDSNIYIALELAQRAYEAHGLSYKKGLLDGRVSAGSFHVVLR
jgi:hypothetical protein